MADPRHEEILKSGVEKFNLWRQSQPEIIPNLEGVELQDLSLQGINLKNANLNSTTFFSVDLSKSDLSMTSFQFANIYESNLENADLRGANFTKTDGFLPEMIEKSIFDKTTIFPEYLIMELTDD